MAKVYKNTFFISAKIVLKKGRKNRRNFLFLSVD